MERQFPKNVKQIGNVCDEPKIYVEDYVDTYLNQLKEKAVLEPIGVMLAGEIVKQEGQDIVYISGAVQIPEMKVNGSDIQIADEVQELVKAEREEYFSRLDFVGWCLIETGHPMGLTRGIHQTHAKLFSDANTIFIWRDAVDHDEMFYAQKYGELMQMGGHYIYYEKNPSMQNYMINTRRSNGVTPSEMVEDRAAKNFRSTVKEKMEYKEQRQNSRFVYAMSIMLVVIVLAIGISTMNNFDRMAAVQESIDSLSLAVSQSKTVDSENENSENTTSETAEQEKTEGQNEPEAEDEADGQAAQDEEEESSEQEREVLPQEDKKNTVPTSGGTVPEYSTIQEQLGQEQYYTVKEGDTLDSISIELYGKRSYVDAICKMNGLEDGNLIFIGQKLLLP